MTIPANYGALGIPVPAPATGATAGDPALDYLGAYLQTFLTTYTPAGWGSVAPIAAEPIVRTIFTHDPEEGNFSDRDLPALFLFRSGTASEPEQIAEDYRVTPEMIRIFWVLPGSSQTRQIPQLRFRSAVGKLIDMAVEQGRDPSWVVAGDTEPSAATRGSLVHNWAGFFSLDVIRWTPSDLLIAPFAGKGATRKYHILDIELRAVEQLTIDPTAGTYPAAMEAIVTSGGMDSESESPAD